MTEAFTCNSGRLVAELRVLRDRRLTVHAESRDARLRRTALSRQERQQVLATTASRCHVCGGAVDRTWQADHVLAHSGGGPHAVDNYLPAHELCNTYRWDYLPEEFQVILKLGVWARTQVVNETAAGKVIADGFTAHERRRLSRRRSLAGHGQ